MAYILGSMSEEDPQGAAEPAVNLRDNAVAPARQTIAEILERMPAEPGVYIMKDRRGKAVYIGKAGVLRNRVRQYFQAASGDTRDFVPLLGRILGDIETVVVNNEKEALLLENNLIKQHQPRFNVKLVDDKNYLVLRLDPEARCPRLEVMRAHRRATARKYFGPYHSATSCRETLRVVNRHFKLRTCTDHVLQLAQAALPAVPDQALRRALRLPVSRRGVRQAGAATCALFLEGKDDELLPRLGARMKEAAGAHGVRARRRGARPDPGAREDARGAARGLDRLRRPGRLRLLPRGRRVEIVVLSIRSGKLIGRRNFSLHAGRSSPTRRSCRRSSVALLRPRRLHPRRGAAAVRDRRRASSRPSG